eukprot:19051-Heterococcus_DN1.PRE.1
MEYFKKFLKEVLRLVPPVSKFYRLVIEDFTVDGYTIPEGYTYAYNIAAAAVSALRTYTYIHVHKCALSLLACSSI